MHPASSVVARSQQSTAAVAKLFADSELGPLLERVEHRLQQELQSRYECLAPILRHGVLLGGKRLRPALVLLAGGAGGQISETHVVIATVLEMIHTATLVHDDVLDGADQRRHLPTVNAKWDQQTSILLGDYLFAQSFYLAASLGDVDVCQLIGEAARQVCEGELRQIHSQGDLELDEQAYLSIIHGKTAELCAVACRLGAKYAGAREQEIESLQQFGTALGIAFQIADDYLDLWGDVGQTGKTLGTDLLQGKLTLPIIRLLSVSDEQQRDAIREILQGPAAIRLEGLQPFLANSDAAIYTRRRALDFVRQAIDAVDRLPNSPAREILESLARFSVDRQF